MSLASSLRNFTTSQIPRATDGINKTTPDAKKLMTTGASGANNVSGALITLNTSDSDKSDMLAKVIATKIVPNNGSKDRALKKMAPTNAATATMTNLALSVKVREKGVWRGTKLGIKPEKIKQMVAETRETQNREEKVFELAESTKDRIRHQAGSI